MEDLTFNDFEEEGNQIFMSSRKKSISRVHCVD